MHYRTGITSCFDGLHWQVAAARAEGVNSVVLFPKTPDSLKSYIGEEAFSPNGLAQRSIAKLKSAFPDLEVRAAEP